MKAIMEKDIIGKRYGSLVVLGFSDKRDKGNHKYLVCRCDCGNEKVISMTHVRSGASKSCGCGVVKTTIKRSTTHNGTHTRIYHIWLGIRRRCYNPNDFSYRYYGARGIKMAEEWSDFSTFREWSKTSGYSDNLTIERIDVNGDYCPSNCKWITLEEQARNKRTNRLVTINGVTKLMTDWLKDSNVSTTQVYWRLRHGWDIESALFDSDHRKIERKNQNG